MNELKELIAKAFEEHMRDHTATADFEACANPLCQIASRAEERVRTLEAERDGEVDEFNAGYDAARKGKPISAEPDGCKYDVWRIGWVWGDYQSKAQDTDQDSLAGKADA